MPGQRNFVRPRSNKGQWRFSVNGRAAESAPPCFAHQRLTTRPFYCVWKPAFGWARSAPCAGRMPILPAACCIFDAQPIESTTAGARSWLLKRQRPTTPCRRFRCRRKCFPYCVPSGRAKMITCLPAVTSRWNRERCNTVFRNSRRNWAFLPEIFTYCVIPLRRGALTAVWTSNLCPKFSATPTCRSRCKCTFTPLWIPSAVRWRRQASCPAFLSGRSKAVP